MTYDVSWCSMIMHEHLRLFFLQSIVADFWQRFLNASRVYNIKFSFIWNGKVRDFAVAHLKENNGGKKVKRSTDGEGNYYSYSEEWIVVVYAVLELIVVYCFVMGV